MDTIKDPLFDKLYHIDQFMNVLALVLSESLLHFLSNYRWPSSPRHI